MEQKENKELIGTLYEIEKRHIESVLNIMNNNKTKAAKALGISLKTLYNKLESYKKAEGDANEQN